MLTENQTAKTPDQLRTAQDFLTFFDAIPDEKWCRGTFENEDGQRCAEGHLRYAMPNYQDHLPCTLEKLLKEVAPDACRITWINDFPSDLYKQPTPKARICAALRDAIAKGK